jgi:uncharacterized protein (DUF433 family)
MARYALNLPEKLKHKAEALAEQQGVSLNQFILWSVAEKVGELSTSMDDPAFPGITYRRGASGVPQPVLRGTALRVQTIALASQVWQMSAEEIASEYSLSQRHVEDCLRFYESHRAEMDLLIEADENLARAGVTRLA